MLTNLSSHKLPLSPSYTIAPMSPTSAKSRWPSVQGAVDLCPPIVSSFFVMSPPTHACRYCLFPSTTCHPYRGCHSHTHGYTPMFPPRPRSHRAFVTDMFTKGIIIPSTSDWVSEPNLVKKDDSMFPFCIDFRPLNKVTILSGSVLRERRN